MSAALVIGGAATASHKVRPPPQALDIRKALATTPPLPDFVLPGLSTGTVGAVIAPGATGKTLLLLQICTALAAGVPVLGTGLFSGGSVAATPAKVVLVVAEEGAALMHARLHAAVAELLRRHSPDLFATTGVLLNDLLAENLKIYPLAGQLPMLLDSEKGDRRSHGLDVLAKSSEGARLVVVDPLRQFHTGDENDSWVMTKLMQDLQMLACAGERAVLLAHHTNKSSTTNGHGDRAGAARGSGALTDAVRWQMNLSALDDDLAAAYGITADQTRQHVRIDLAKSNYLAPQAPMVLRRGPGGAFSTVTLPRGNSSAKTRSAARRSTSRSGA